MLERESEWIQCALSIKGKTAEHNTEFGLQSFNYNWGNKNKTKNIFQVLLLQPHKISCSLKLSNCSTDFQPSDVVRRQVTLDFSVFIYRLHT